MTASAAALALVQTTTLTRLVAEAIEEQILSGRLPPGSKLNEMALAQQFDISRGPLREALRLLEEAKLIRQEKNRGAWVRQIALAEAADIYDVRAGLDATAGYLLAARITDEQIVTLRQLTETMREVRETEVERFHELNLAFHDRLIAMTGNTVLIDQYRRLCKLLVLFRRRNLRAPQAIPHFAEEHAAIVELIAARQGTAAARALFDHAQGGRQRMLHDGELSGCEPGAPDAC